MAERILVTSKLPHNLRCHIPGGAIGLVKVLFVLDGNAQTSVDKEAWDLWVKTGHPAIAAGTVFVSPVKEPVKSTRFVRPSFESIKLADDTAPILE